MAARPHRWVLPDGGVVYGSRTQYNGFRGHLMKFDSQGHYSGSYDFGWDITPAVHRHRRGYSLFIKDNHYLSNGPFNVTRLGADLNKIDSQGAREGVPVQDGRIRLHTGVA